MQVAGVPMKSEKSLIRDDAMSYQNTLVLRFVMLAAILVLRGAILLYVRVWFGTES